ncbi:MAG: metal-dependent hydrolase [Candidatus Competibacteraceae bacterium]|nr:metal-dependent hydrolase [Candidatus Competibacteraceae bacterium]MBK8184624.1 metal-dependent hydrolase [Candidatus Competibacteraceae bacterium]
MAVASLGPDVDLPTSKVGRLFFWLSVPLERRFGHRTVTHSVVGLLTVALYPLSWMGFRDALQAVVRSFDISVEQYQRQIGTHW